MQLGELAADLLQVRGVLHALQLHLQLIHAGLPLGSLLLLALVNGKSLCKPRSGGLLLDRTAPGVAGFLSLLDLVLGSSGAGSRTLGWGCLGCLFRSVAVHTLHVVQKVVLPRESVVMGGAVAVLEFAEVWLVSVSVEAVGFALMTQETGGGGEAVVVAVLVLAAEGLDVRINILAVWLLLVVNSCG